MTWGPYLETGVIKLRDEMNPAARIQPALSPKPCRVKNYFETLLKGNASMSLASVVEFVAADLVAKERGIHQTPSPWGSLQVLVFGPEVISLG
jgi:hypothetical protein